MESFWRDTFKEAATLWTAVGAVATFLGVAASLVFSLLALYLPKRAADREHARKERIAKAILPTLMAELNDVLARLDEAKNRVAWALRSYGKHPSDIHEGQIYPPTVEYTQAVDTFAPVPDVKSGLISAAHIQFDAWSSYQAFVADLPDTMPMELRTAYNGAGRALHRLEGAIALWQPGAPLTHSQLFQYQLDTMDLATQVALTRDVLSDVQKKASKITVG
jgi:hypothetical protein